MAYFEKLPIIQYEGANTESMFAFKYYNPKEKILGKPMKDHLHLSLSYWCSRSGRGGDVEKGSLKSRDSGMEVAYRQVDAFFEVMHKLGLEYFSFQDIDLVAPGTDLNEFLKNLDDVTDYIKIKMRDTGIKLLWNTASPLAYAYHQEADRSTPVDRFAYNAAQVKKGIEISKKLEGKNYLLLDILEGGRSSLAMDPGFELDNMAAFFRMAISYAKSIDHVPLFLIQPKSKTLTKSQIGFDAVTAMAFLQKYKLDSYIKLNLEINHDRLSNQLFERDLMITQGFKGLGSIGVNQEDYLWGYDETDNGSLDLDVTLVLYQILKSGGLNLGGINFDSKIQSPSFEIEDFVLAYIFGIDTYARALRGAAAMAEDGLIRQSTEEHYDSYKSTALGQSILEGRTDFESLSRYALKKRKRIGAASNDLSYIKSAMSAHLI